MRRVLVPVLLALALPACVFVRAAFPPDIIVPAITVDVSPARVERGKYLVENVAACLSCHGERDWGFLAAPRKEGTEGVTGEIYDAEDGFPGTLPSPNITPARLSSWSDGEILRALAFGVSKDGTALFPIMPYKHYANASREDLYSIIAYLRQLPAKESVTPERTIDQPLDFISRSFPEARDLREVSPRPGDADYDGYVTELAGCISCHTPVDDRGRPKEGMDFAGGRVFRLPTGGDVWSSNITPDDETGIGKWSREEFIQRFRATTPETARAVAIPNGSFNTVMPWSDYAGMSDEDLGAIYDHLRTLAPVKRQLTRFTPPGPPTPATDR